MAYRELDLATSRQQDHLLPLRDLAMCRCRGTSTRARSPSCEEVWAWLEAIVAWLNPSTSGMSPMSSRPVAATSPFGVRDRCSRRSSATAPVKRSPVRRWRSGTDTACHLTERMRTRLRNHYQEDHQSWPAKARSDQGPGCGPPAAAARVSSLRFGSERVGVSERLSRRRLRGLPASCADQVPASCATTGAKVVTSLGKMAR